MKKISGDEYASASRSHTSLTDDDFTEIALMRKYQKLYFATKDRDTLILAKSMETRVDAMIERVIKSQQAEQLGLFEEGSPI